ncbi:hypothetical protein GOODEAATRI_002295 [Goodea atripinnis]|uniref:Uncharacterized protein n=1 Tax=Goodea atripinnis TaxID=208336 RepID=A0ABV0PK65_9TELE
MLACASCGVPLQNRLRQVENLLFTAELPPSGMPQPCSGRRGDAPAEECHSPRRTRPRLERPSRQEVDSLRAEVEQLKALLKAPEPIPAFQEAAAAWESGEDLKDDGISVRASNSEFHSLEDQRDPYPHPRDREGDPPSIGGNDASGNSQGRSHARYRQLFWQPWPRSTWTMHPWPGQWETHFFAGLRRPLRSRCHRRRPSWTSFSAAGGILEASPTMVETHGSWRACAILWITASHHRFFPQMRRSGRGPAVQAPSVG